MESRVVVNPQFQSPVAGFDAAIVLGSVDRGRQMGDAVAAKDGHDCRGLQAALPTTPRVAERLTRRGGASNCPSRCESWRGTTPT